MRGCLATGLALAALLSAFPGLPPTGHAAEQPVASPTLTVTGPAVPLLASGQPDCGPHDVPDAGLRAFRRFDGQVVAFASETDNDPMVGSSLLSLDRTCHPAYKSNHDPDPAHFDDQTWIAATWTDNGRDVMAIGHHEYHGELHPGHCQGTTARKCRYGVLLHLISHDGGMHFIKSTSTPLAALAITARPDQSRDTGFFQPSNIFERDGWKYVFIRSSGGGDQPPATCLMRARDPLDPNSWTFYDGASFRPALFDPYKAGDTSHPPCAQIQNLNGLVWSVVTDRAGGGLVALLTRIDGRTGQAYVAMSGSGDIMHWTPSTRVPSVPLQWTSRCPTEPYYHYPSLIDPGSQRRNFDDISPHPIVTLSKIAIANCRFAPRRDLIRLPAELSRSPG